MKEQRPGSAEQGQPHSTQLSNAPAHKGPAARNSTGSNRIMGIQESYGNRAALGAMEAPSPTESSTLDSSQDSALLSQASSGAPSAPPSSTPDDPLASRMGAAPVSLPYLAEMEESFGEDLSGVEAWLGETDQMDRLAAQAASSQEVVVFRDSDPSRETVAHEVAHILQARGGSTPPGVGAPQSAAEHEAEQAESRASAGMTQASPRAGPGGQVQLDPQDTWREAHRRAMEIKDALLDHWDEDEEKALRQIRGQSTLMLREIRAQYLSLTSHVLETDFQEYCNSDQYREALGILWATMSLEDRIRSNVEEGWLWDSANEEGILDVLRTASTAQLREAAGSENLMQLLRNSLDDDEYYQARKIISPDHIYDIVVERIRNARGWIDDDESATFNVILDLSVAERRRLWNENQEIFSFLSDSERQSARTMCLGTQADALQERMDIATSGWGTDDDAVALVVGQTSQAGQRERLIRTALRTGQGPNGQQLTQEELQQLRQALANLGGIQENLLTVQRDTDGEIAQDSFLGMMHGDLSEGEFQSFSASMGVDRFQLAKQQILDAIGFWNDDEASIQQAFNTLVGQLDLGEDESLRDLSPEERARRQRQANQELRQRLWDDPDVQQALGHLNQGELDVVEDYASADTYRIALRELESAFYAFDTDEERIFRIVAAMSAEDRARFLEESPRLWITMQIQMSRQEVDLVRQALRTGRIPTQAALDWAFGGSWDGTEDEMIAQVFGTLTQEERATYRLGYWLYSEHREPADEHQRAALLEFTTLYQRMQGELGDDDLQQAMDQLIGTPSPQELQTEEGRLMAAGIMHARMQDKESLGSGLADAFTDTDETADQASVQLESAFQDAMADGAISQEELAVLAALDANFANRYQEHLQTVDLVRGIASTVAAIAVGILVTVLTGGTAGPAAAGLLAEYGAAALAGGLAGAAAKVGTAEAFAGDHYDTFSTEGATDALSGFADGATAVLAAGIATRFTNLVGLTRAALASEMTAGALESTSAAISYAGRSFAAGALRGTIEGFLGGAVGELILTAADAETWRRSVWDVICRLGLAILRGGGIGAATGLAMGGAAEALSAVVQSRRVTGLLTQLQDAGLDQSRLDDLGLDVVQSLGQADNALANGNMDEAAQIFRSLRSQLSPDELLSIRRALTLHHTGVDPLASHLDRIQELNATGAFDNSGFHGSQSDMLDGLEDTEGQLMSAQALHDRNVQQVSGEGDAFSGASGLKQNIFIGEGEPGLGTSLAYAQAAGDLNHYNVQRYTFRELEDEIDRINTILDNWENIDVQVGGVIAPHVTKEQGQFAAQLQRLRDEMDLRMALPAHHPRRLGGPGNVQNYPILFEFDTSGLDTTPIPRGGAGSPLAGEATVPYSLDLTTRLQRVYVPLDQVDDVQQRLAGILGHSDFEVIAIEALDSLPATGAIGSTRAATYDTLGGLQDNFLSIQRAYELAATTGQPIDAEFALREILNQ